jgi:hypothetical protein
MRVKMAFQSLRLIFMLIFFTFFLIPFGLLTFFPFYNCTHTCGTVLSTNHHYCCCY